MHRAFAVPGVMRRAPDGRVGQGRAGTAGVPAAEAPVPPLRRQALLQQLTLRGEGASCVSEVIIGELKGMALVMSLHRLLDGA